MADNQKESKAIAKVDPKPFQMIQVVDGSKSQQTADTKVRIAMPGSPQVDLAAEKHANNISRALAKSAGRVSYRLFCIQAGLGDPEAK